MTQEEFDSYFITSNEVCEELNITKPAIIMAKRRGDLPPSLKIGESNRSMFWVRHELRPYIELWKANLNICKKGPKRVGG